jgi:integrase
VRPADDDDVAVIEPHVSRQIWAMDLLQRYTGMRPGEVTIMRGCDIDQLSSECVYTPSTHKTEHHGLSRTITLGPKALLLLLPWIERHPAGFLLRLSEAESERLAKLRKHPDAGHPAILRLRGTGDHYRVAAYGRAIARGCEKTGVATLAPNRLLHAYSKEVWRMFSLDAAQQALGHATPLMTLRYAEANMDLARQASRAIG